ncbi:MAG TPA: efflux RND transporter periplasmic adaptor subunit [Methylomirabilota bacterium]|nr:efflux RND transporter periplasmic adaptor subunit [Methylomirabilota bacterium]
MAKTKTSKRRKALVLTALALAVIALVTVAAFRKKEVIITIQTDKVTRRDITEIVVANGKIQPVVQVVIQPEVSGEITALPVKEGQSVKRGDLLVKIKPDNYLAGRNSAEANYKSAMANRTLAKANLDKAELEFRRYEQLHKDRLISDSQFLEAKTNLDVARASFETSIHQSDQAKASLARAEDDLAKTTIVSPINGTVTRLRSQAGERVVGTAMMSGTEIMTIAALDEMEARVDIGEVDLTLLKLGQRAKLEVEAFADRKFNGVVTEIANSSKQPYGVSSQAAASNTSAQEAVKFEVRIRLTEKEDFRPGMSVTAEIETRSVTNALTVPIQCVTSRLPKDAKPKMEHDGPPENEAPAQQANRKKKEDGPKPLEVVFLPDGDKAKMAPVKVGISDDSYIEVKEGLTEGQEVISGGYKAISKELEEGKRVKKGPPPGKDPKKNTNS